MSMYQKIVHHLINHLCYVVVGLFFFQYIKNKRYKYGIKFFKIAQYDGIIFWVSVYLWHSYNNDKNLGQTDATVLQLAHYFLDKGNLLFVDNCDNSS